MNKIESKKHFNILKFQIIPKKKKKKGRKRYQRREKTEDKNRK